MCNVLSVLGFCIQFHTAHPAASGHDMQAEHSEDHSIYSIDQCACERACSDGETSEEVNLCHQKEPLAWKVFVHSLCWFILNHVTCCGDAGCRTLQNILKSKLFNHKSQIFKAPPPDNNLLNGHCLRASRLGLGTQYLGSCP